MFIYKALHLPLHCLVISGIHHSQLSLPRTAQDHQQTSSSHCPLLFQTVSEVLKNPLSTSMSLLTQGLTLHKHILCFPLLNQICITTVSYPSHHWCQQHILVWGYRALPFRTQDSMGFQAGEQAMYQTRQPSR